MSQVFPPNVSDQREPCPTRVDKYTPKPSGPASGIKKKQIYTCRAELTRWGYAAEQSQEHSDVGVER